MNTHPCRSIKFLPILALAGALVGCTHRTVIVDRREPEVRTTERVIVQTPPPQPRVERDPEPRSGYVWVPGYYRHNGREYVWVEGRWERTPRQGARYIPGRWDRDDRGYFWVEGRWD